MAKPLAQKRQEAGWRKIRVDLLWAFREGSDEKVLSEYGPWKIERREQLWQNYLAIPLAWRRTGMDGCSVPEHLAVRLKMEAIEQHARDLDGSTAQVERRARRMRL